MEHQDWLGSIITHHIKFHPSDDLQTFLEQLILIWHLTYHDSHSLEAVSHSSLSQFIDQAIFPFISYIFPMISHCVSFYYSFSLWFIIWFSMLFWAGTFWNIPMTHWWAITYRSQTCCLVVHDSLLYIKRLSCLRERTIRFRITLVNKVLSSTVLITASGFVITSHLNHFDYIIRVCLYHASSLLQHKVSKVKNIFWGIHWIFLMLH